jgi:hypothetical protein
MTGDSVKHRFIMHKVAGYRQEDEKKKKKTQRNAVLC